MPAKHTFSRTVKNNLKARKKSALRKTNLLEFLSPLKGGKKEQQRWKEVIGRPRPLLISSAATITATITTHSLQHAILFMFLTKFLLKSISEYELRYGDGKEVDF